MNYIINEHQNNYQDQYFSKGHWILKIRQTLFTLIFWLFALIPVIITISTYLAYRSHGRHGHFFWYYREGFHELNFLIIFLLFALGMITVFCLTMAYIQVQRLHGLIEKWPMFNISQNKRKRQAAEDFMTKRFGTQEKRHQTRFYTVNADQNLTKNQLIDIINYQEEK